MKTRGTRPLVAHGVDELPGLIVTKGHQRIALPRVPWRARPAPELLWDADRFQSGPASRAGLQLVPFSGAEHKAALAPIDFDIVQAARALVPAAGQLRTLQDSRRPALELSQYGHPIVQVGDVSPARL